MVLLRLLFFIICELPCILGENITLVSYWFLEFKVFFLLGWLPLKFGKPGLFCYLTHSLGQRARFIPFPSIFVQKWKWTHLADPTFHTYDHHSMCISLLLIYASLNLSCYHKILQLRTLYIYLVDTMNLIFALQLLFYILKLNSFSCSDSFSFITFG